ncbi:MAG: potassium transporter Kup [Archangiaceae bacterium]|nr:potassium transporter Kup [Archangiaceae bacterium]
MSSAVADPSGQAGAAPSPAQPAAPTPGASHGHHGPKGKLVPLALGALGVVYGDIGTSVLYAVKECFNGEHAVPATHENVLGILSLFFWSLMSVVSFKYLAFVTRANNKGEGGIFALLALIPPKLSPLASRQKTVVVLLGIFGAALLYGDGMITPAISVLSAVEGLKGSGGPFAHLIVPITVGIIIGLFALQSRGTGGIGRLFGPVMLVWFVSIAALGVPWIIRRPEVLHSLDPRWAFRFLEQTGLRGAVVLGSVVLCITGAEALYADMGHFGIKSIRISWISLVGPSLVLNYLGQGALMLEGGEGTKTPFYGIVPDALHYPMVVLATAAAIIASQAMISGAFSLTRQAVQLGFFPRVTIVHTSTEHEGQIYIPEISRALEIACVVLVLAFQDSSRLATAYGIAVTGTFCITSLVFGFVVTRAWGWPLWKVAPLVVFFLLFDGTYFASTLIKFFDGGWVPIVTGVFVFALMTTWKRGRAEMARRFATQTVPLEALLEDFTANPPHRVRGTAIFMAGNPTGTPPVMLHHLKHNQVLHRQVVLLSIVSEAVPVVPPAEALQVEALEHGFYRVVFKTGFMETPNVPQVLLRARAMGLVCEPSTTSYYLGRETLLTTGKSSMMRWRKALFAFVSRNARSATSYFGIPPGRVVELGMQVDL